MWICICKFFKRTCQTHPYIRIHRRKTLNLQNEHLLSQIGHLYWPMAMRGEEKDSKGLTDKLNPDVKDSLFFLEFKIKWVGIWPTSLP